MTEELIDRFGDPPKSVENLLWIARIKSMAHRLYITEVAGRGDTIRFTLYEKARIDVAAIPGFVASLGAGVKFTADAKAPYFTWFFRQNSRDRGRDIRELLEEFLTAADVLLPKETEP